MEGDTVRFYAVVETERETNAPTDAETYFGRDLNAAREDATDCDMRKFERRIYSRDLSREAVEGCGDETDLFNLFAADFEKHGKEETSEYEIVCDDALTTTAIAPGSVDLIVTSPPYNLGKEYGECDDEKTYEEYLVFTEKYLTRCFEWMKEDGRLCLNVPLDINRGGTKSVGADVTEIAKNVGLKYQSTIVWNEGNTSKNTAWGSWLSASAPYVIAPAELVLVFCKRQWKKMSEGKSDIGREEFMEWTSGVWNFAGEGRQLGHPAPFPLELPKRCIKLFSYVGDTVLDPFLGSGSTLVEAKRLKRRGIGIEIEPRFCKLARRRIETEGNVQMSIFDEQ